MVLLLANRQKGDDPLAGHNGCLFSALLQNSHGNQALGIAAFYPERCILHLDNGCVSIECPVRRAGLDGKYIGPFFAEYAEAGKDDTLDPVPFACVKATIKTVRQGLFRRRRYSVFSFRTISTDGQRRCSVVESWISEQGHTWALLDENENPMAAVREIPDQTGQGLVTFHLFITERDNMNAGLVLGCVLMMTAAGILPGGPRFTEALPRLAQHEPIDHSFFADAERDEWGAFSSQEQ